MVFDFVSSKSLVCINCMLIFYKVFGQSCKWYISQNFHWGIFLKHKIFTTNSLPATNVDSWDTRGMTRKYAVDFLFVLVRVAVLAYVLLNNPMVKVTLLAIIMELKRWPKATKECHESFQVSLTQIWCKAMKFH